MKDSDHKTDAYIQQKYIQLLEESNRNLYRKTNLFSRKHLGFYSLLFIAVLVLSRLIYQYQLPNDIFEGHLIKTSFNTHQILLETQEGTYYQISKNTHKKWLSGIGLFVDVNDQQISFTGTKTLKRSDKTSYTIWVPKNKQYRVITPDGSKIRLNSNSKLTFSNTRKTTTKNAVLEGEAFFEIAHNPKQAFTIQASKMSVEVYGTTFNISNYSTDDATSLSLVNGSVRITKEDKKSLMVKPGQQVFLKNGMLRVKEADFSTILSWTSEHLYFDGEALESITRKIASWYNVQFVFKNEALKSIPFTGNLTKDKGLMFFLQMLQYTEGIQYKINNKEIILFKQNTHTNH